MQKQLVILMAIIITVMAGCGSEDSSGDSSKTVSYWASGNGWTSGPYSSLSACQSYLANRAGGTSSGTCTSKQGDGSYTLYLSDGSIGGFYPTASSCNSAAMSRGGGTCAAN